MKNKNKLILATVLMAIVILTIVLAISLHIRKESKNKNVIQNKDFTEVNLISSKSDVKDGYVYTNYEEFSKNFTSSKINRTSFNSKNYVLIVVSYDSCRESDITPTDYKIKNNKINVTMKYTARCGGCAPQYIYYLLKVDKSIKNTEVDVDYKAVNDPKCPRDVAYKPIIYLYPKEETTVEVKLVNSNLLTTTYPKYKDSWKVKASPNGKLIDANTNRELYGLYWEGNNHKVSQKEDGFVVKGEDTISFLEEKLSILGLTEREADEFIIYWLPKLENNKYNYIRFETEEEINNYMPLAVNPNPDTVIRVLMDYKPLDKEIKVKEQKLTKKARTGFTLVEWGGSKIN